MKRRHYNQLDPLIAPVVHYLQGAGFRTFSSCQGGRGHAFDLPTVLMHCDDQDRTPEQTRKRLAKMIHHAGWQGGFDTFVRCQHCGHLAEPHCIVTLEFWSKECLKKRKVD